MTVEEADVVDSMGIDRETGDVVLLISDHLPWDLESDHLLQLQAKLNHYLAFCLDGQLHSEYPEYADRQIVIRILHKFPPDAVAQRFLKRAAWTVAKRCALAHANRYCGEGGPREAWWWGGPHARSSQFVIPGRRPGDPAEPIANGRRRWGTGSSIKQVN